MSVLPSAMYPTMETTTLSPISKDRFAYLVLMEYPAVCLVSPAITEKSAPAIARIEPPLSVYGLNRLMSLPLTLQLDANQY